MTRATLTRRRLIAVAAAIASLTATTVTFAHGEGAPGAAAPAAGTAYATSSSGTRALKLGPVTIRMLVEAANLGTAGVEVGELHLPPGSGTSAAHAHGSLEIFYVVSGTLGHEVNGTLVSLQAGDVGLVKPGDQVRHSVLSEDGVKAVVIWVPGGEADRLVEHAGFIPHPIE